ncbi:MAG: hypothetical protein ABSD12_15305 [Paraburkholderia sp.]|jgi:hypothetical protein
MTSYFDDMTRKDVKLTKSRKNDVNAVVKAEVKQAAVVKAGVLKA